MCGRPAQSKLSAELRRNGCSRTVSFTAMLSMNATVTSCGPAGTGTRTRIRSSTASPVSVGLSNIVARSSLPPIVTWCTSRPSMGNLELARVLQAADDVQVGAIELGLELVLAVERKRVPDAQAADRAERQPLDVLVLRQILRHAVGVASRTHRRIADGKALMRPAAAR